MKKNNTVYSIQVFRGIATILVVLYHETQIFIDNYQVPPIRGFFLFGFCGVHLFFVLSGFIIFMIHSSDINKPRQYLIYMKKRFVRIYPSYWITLSILSCFFLFRETITIQDVYNNIALIIMPLNFINPVCWTLTVAPHLTVVEYFVT